MALFLGLFGVFIAGVLGGLLGVGGGVLMVPILVLLLGRDMHVAIGTSLALIIPTAIGGVLFHWCAGRVDVKLFCAFAVFALVGGIVGAWFSGSIGPVMLRKIFAAVLLILSIRMFFAP